jgi:predicted NBD/HSP70 family sugar kinase
VPETLPPPRLAVDLGGTTIRAARVRGGDVIERRAAATPAAEGPDAVVATCARLVEPWTGSGLDLCVAATGRVHDGRVSAVNQATMPGWDDVPLAERLSERLGVRVRVMNDAHAAAWGEARYGAGRGCRDFLFVTVSTGIGAGLVVAGSLATGARGLAGHLGFWPNEGPDAGVLEHVASGTGIARSGSRALGRPCSTRDVFAAADAGDAAAAAVVDEAVEALARALVQVRWLVDPERVALGGSVGLAPGYLERLRVAVAAHGFVAPLEIVPAALGGDAGLVGAAAALGGGDGLPEAAGAP